MSTATKRKTKAPKSEPSNGIYSCDPPLYGARTREERFEKDIASADADLARRLKGRELLRPFIDAIAAILCAREKAGEIQDVCLEYIEPGEHGPDSGREIDCPERIEFRWRVATEDFDHTYSNAEDFRITLMNGVREI